MEREIEHRIMAYLSGEISDEEKQQLNEWLQEEPHRKEFRELARACNLARNALLWDEISLPAAERRVRRRLSRGRRAWWRAAASIAVIAVAIAWWQRGGGDSTGAGTLPGVARWEKAIPTLTLPDGRVVGVDSLAGEEALPGDIQFTLARASSLEYDRVAPLPPAGDTRYHTLTVPSGCEFTVTLGDGSRVWLNAGSELRYPERFAPGKREVFLSGEAYFEVEHDPRNPFHVKTRGMELTVLGTSFDIKAYPDEAEVVTTLVSGKTLQRFDGRDEEVILLPEQGVIYNTLSRAVTKVDADLEEALSWKEGRIIARHRTLEEIFRLLSKWYDFEVVYTRPALKDIRFYLNIKRYENIQAVLDNIHSTNGITLSYVNNTIYISQ
jgi:ferric-dicitrate binding protein FerR (iron transport regulator)